MRDPAYSCLLSSCFWEQSLLLSVSFLPGDTVKPLTTPDFLSHFTQASVYFHWSLSKQCPAFTEVTSSVK